MSYLKGRTYLSEKLFLTFPPVKGGWERERLDQAFRMCQLISHCLCEGMGMITHEHTRRIVIVIQT
jgi:hypothetical protein